MIKQFKIKFIVRYWREFAISLLVVVLGGLLSYKLYGMHDTKLILAGKNVYFQGDLPRVYENMTDRMSPGHYRVKVHPLISLQTFPPTFFLKKLGMGSFTAVRTVIALIAAIWGLCLYVLIRLIGCSRLIAVIFTILGFSCASAIFWLSVPESYGLGSISIMIALCFAALTNKKMFSDWSYIIVSAVTLSVTITNWMCGIFVTLINKPIKQAINITLISLSIVTIFWGLQKRFFPEAIFFIGDNEETSFLFYPTIERMLSVVNTFFFHPIMAPSINILGDNGEGWNIISFQKSVPGYDSILSFAGTAIWLSIFAIGLWALFSKKENSVFHISLGLTIIGQLLLHLVYGEETFLYSLHFLPLLLALAALGTLTKLRGLVILLVLILIPISATNNWQKFQEVNAIAVSPS